MKRRTFTRTAVLGTAGILTSGLPAMAQQEKFGTKEEIAAAGSVQLAAAPARPASTLLRFMVSSGCQPSSQPTRALPWAAPRESQLVNPSSTARIAVWTRLKAAVLPVLPPS